MPTITVSAMSSGTTWVLEATASTTIGELKVIMQAEHGGGLPSAQTFVLGGEKLNDALTVEDAGVEEETVLSWMATYTVENITIKVNATSIGKMLKLEIPVTMTVLQLKGLMSREYGGGPASGQCFILAGQVLRDVMCLEEEGVLKESVLVWLHGGTPDAVAPPPSLARQQSTSATFLTPLRLSRYIATFDEMEISGSAENINALMKLTVADFVAEFGMKKIHATKLRDWLNQRKEGGGSAGGGSRGGGGFTVPAALIISARGANWWDFFLSHYQDESGDIVGLVRQQQQYPSLFLIFVLLTCLSLLPTLSGRDQARAPKIPSMVRPVVG